MIITKKLFNNLFFGNNNLLDKRFYGICLRMLKDAAVISEDEEMVENKEDSELISTALVRYGILNAETVTKYLNQVPENKFRYIMPSIPNDKERTRYFKFSDYVEPTIDNCNRFAEACYYAKVFPYMVIGDGEDSTIIWIAKENSDDDKIVIGNENNIEFLGTDRMGLKIPVDKFKYVIKYMIGPVFEDEFKNFTDRNNMPDQTLNRFITAPDTLCEYYLVKGIITRASDIFFDPKVGAIQVSYSILGDTIKDDKILLNNEDKQKFLDKVLMLSTVIPKDRDPEQVTMDLSIKNMGELNNSYNGRVNVFKNGKFDAICIRVVDKTKSCIPFKELSIRDIRKKEMEELLHNNAGIVLVAGAPGSGKTTTIYSLLTELRRLFPTKRTETVENPIEQILEDINQLTLEGTSATYDDVAEVLTRRAGKKLFIGELNSPRTIRFCINAALIDLFIISTIHSIDAAMVPDRVRGLLVQDPATFEQFLLVLRGIIHQTMLKEACSNCMILIDRKTDHRITTKMDRVLDYYKFYDEKIPIVVPNPDCPCCHGRGFLIHKPIIAAEVCMIDDDMRETIADSPRGRIHRILYEDMRNRNRTGVQDALMYMRERKIDWMQIWNTFSLANKASSVVMENDERYHQAGTQNVIRSIESETINKDLYSKESTTATRRPSIPISNNGQVDLAQYYMGKEDR